MAPRKSAAAAGPTLSLIIEKGPLSGQTNVYRPGSLVRIGRIARGNTLCIKESGISEKHLLIQFLSAESHRWTITDLASSNGTFLNGAQLDPSQPAPLSHGDVIKFGGETSIRAEFELSGVDSKIETTSGNVRRNARRRVRGGAVDLSVIEEDSELGLVNNKEEDETEKAAVIEAKQGSNVSTRRTRSSAKTQEDINLGQSVITGSRGGVSTRRTRNARKEQDIEDDTTDSKASGIRQVPTRRTRSAKIDQNVDEIGVDSSAIEDKKTRQGRRGRKKQHEETISEEPEKAELIPDHKACEEEKERSKVGDKKVSNSGTENVAVGFTITSSSLVQEGNEEEPNPGHKTREEDEERSEVGVDESGKKEKSSATEGFAAGFSLGVDESKRKMVPDLNKMTLGEWLDFLYVYEPQEIIDQTEEMIAEMKLKAERCHKFRLQHKNAKAVE